MPIDRNSAMRPMEAEVRETEERWIARLAGAGFVLVLAIVAASAYIRLSAGLPETSAAAIEVARVAHRISASLAGLLILAIAGMVLTRGHSRWPDIALATATLVVMLALAWVGRYSGPDATSAVLFTNLIGGLALATLLWAVVARQMAGRVQPGGGTWPGLAPLTLVVAILQSVTGAMTVTGFAKLGLVHYVCGAAAFGLCVWLGVCLARAKQHRKLAYLIIGLALFQAALGISALVFALPVGLVLAHNVGAGLLLAALVHACSRRLRSV